MDKGNAFRYLSATSICNQTFKRAGGCEQRLMRLLGRCIVVPIECGFEDIRIFDRVRVRNRLRYEVIARQ